MPYEGTPQPGFVEAGGIAGILALFAGFVVLGLALLVAARRGPRRHALAVFAAAWLALPIGLFGKSAGEITALHEISQLGPAVTPKDMAAGLVESAGTNASTLLALLLGLGGAVVALARSREEAPAAS